MTLTAVSLFAGVGGFDLAMERNGIETVATVEIDKAARSVLTKRFPNSKHFNDIKETTGEQLRDAGFVPERGIITGGFPCQDLSVAGKRAGLGGSRSGLFWEIVRLLDELQPKFFVLENVPGLLSSNEGRDFGTVLGALVGGGYGVAFRILDAQYFGVPQRRRRVFIVGCLGDDGRTPSEILALAQGVSGDSSSSDETWQDVASDAPTGFRTSSHAGYERGVGTLRSSGGDLHGGSETLVAVPLTAHHGRNNADETLIARTLTARHDSSPDGDRGFNVVTVGALQARDYKGTGSTIDDKLVIAATLTSGADGKAGRRREDDTNLVPTLLTMREGKDGGGKGPLVSPDVSLTLATGNGQVLIQPHVKIVRSGARDENGNLPAEVWAEREVAPTLNSMDNTGESRATVPVGEQTAVRRLTPTECTRLQGFPDSWQEVHNANAIEAHADQILRLLWLSAYPKAREGWRPGISAALLTPEVLCAGVHGGWVSWEVAGECAASRGAIQGEEPWPEGFLLEMRRCSQHRPSPYQRESFGQLAHELGRPLSAMPLSDAQARQALLDSELWAQASEEWPLRYARSETEGWSSPSSLADSARYKQMGNAVCVNVVEWIMKRLVEVDKNAK